MLFRSIITLLPTVQRILLSGILERLAGDILRGYPARLSVQCLQLSTGPIGGVVGFDTLRSVTDMFLDIHELVFKRFWFVASATDPAPTPPTCVRHIHYDRTWTDLDTFLKLIPYLDTQQLHSLTTLIQPLGGLPMCWPTFCGVLKTIGPQLTRLGLHVEGWSGADPRGYRYFVACSGAVLTHRSGHPVYGAFFTSCTKLQVLCLTFDRWGFRSEQDDLELYRLGWEQLLSLLPRLSRSVHHIIIELNSFDDDFRFLRGAEDVISKFVCAVAERQPQTKLSVRLADHPILSHEEQEQIREVFPRLSGEALLDF